jgi:hypothetical protein
MRLSKLAPFAALLSLTACSSGRVVVASGGPDPAPPHPVEGPVATLGIPPGHYPPPGYCRVWVPGRPPGHQPAAVPCSALGDPVPLGAWVLHRPLADGTYVEVTAYHESQPQVIVSVEWYDAESGELVRHGKGAKHSKGRGHWK